MRITVAIFAVWTVCLISAPRPSPSGQKATITAQQQTKPDKYVAKPSPSSTRSASKDTAQSTANQNGGAVKGGENERAVRIVSIPPRSAGDTVALVCTVVLTLVGIGGIIAAFCTLRTIRRQTDATWLNAQAVIKAARAWVMVDIEWQQPGPHLVEGDGAQGNTTGIFVQCICANQGKSIAQVTEKGYVFGIMATPLRAEPDFSPIDIFHRTCEYIKPDGVSEPYKFLAICPGCHPKQNLTMVLYGRVKYKDVFGERETRFGYMITGMGNLDRLPAESYPEYNKHI